MKKYAATNNHPYIKEGILLSKTDTGYNIAGRGLPCFPDSISVLWVADGWIEEVQEPEFTKLDMKLFGATCAQEWEKHKLLNVEHELDKFIKL